MVITSLEDADGFRCVDIIAHSDGTFGFKEFRRDPEDGGRWTLVNDFTGIRYASQAEALDAAAASVAWLAKYGSPRS